MAPFPATALCHGKGADCGRMRVRTGRNVGTGTPTRELAAAAAEYLGAEGST